MCFSFGTVEQPRWHGRQHVGGAGISTIFRDALPNILACPQTIHNLIHSFDLSTHYQLAPSITILRAISHTPTTMPRPTHRTLHEHDPTYIWKLLLRAFALPFALIAIGTTAWALAYQPTPSLTSPQPNYLIYTNFLFAWILIAVPLSLLWNLANILTLLIRHAWIHPGANVACDLLLWLGLLVTGIFATIGALNLFPEYNPAVSGDSPDAAGYNQYTSTNGSVYTTYPNGTLSDQPPPPCPAFTSCQAETDYQNALNHKGIVIIVGCAFTFVIL